MVDAGFLTGKKIKQWVFYRRDEKRKNRGLSHCALKRRMNAHRNDGNRSAVQIKGRVIHPLIVEGQLRRLEYGGAVVGLQNLLGTRVRELSITHHKA